MPMVTAPTLVSKFARYNIWLLDWTGAKLKQLFPGDDFLSMAWQHKINQPGVFRLELVAEGGTKDLFVVDYGVLVERNHGAGLYDEYVGIHLDTEEWLVSGDVDEHYWASMGFSPEWLLDQPLLQPVVSANPDWPRYDMWWDYGPADDVIKRMAAESMLGPEAERNFSNFAVQGDTGEGAWGVFEGRYGRLLQAMRDAVGEDGSRGRCDFRVERVSGGYELRTYAPFYGTDRRRGNAAGIKPTVFSLELENVLNPKRQVVRHAEVTVAVGGWAGGGIEQDIFERSNADALAESPFRRREEFYDLRDVSTPDQMDAILDQALVDDGRREIVEFDPVQTNACLYGRDWGPGDLVTLDLWGKTYDMRITEVMGRIDGDNEETIQGKAELWDRLELVE